MQLEMQGTMVDCIVINLESVFLVGSVYLPRNWVTYVDICRHPGQHRIQSLWHRVLQGFQVFIFGSNYLFALSGKVASLSIFQNSQCLSEVYVVYCAPVVSGIKVKMEISFFGQV